MPLAVLAGAIANKPGNGGEAWVRLNWLLGLRRLGWEVLFVECLGAGLEQAAGRDHLDAAMAEHGLGDRWALLDERGGSVGGLPRPEVNALAAEAEVLFNHSGHLPPGPLRDAPRSRVYVDLDPAFTQIWDADPSVAFSVAGHDRHVTVGLAIGSDGCRLPAGGIDWIPTPPPVVLDLWSQAPLPAGGPFRFTTVATWRSPYGGLPVDGRIAPGKHHEFRRLSELPGRVERGSFELALDIHPGDAADLEALRGAGWTVVAPADVAATPAAFAAYVRGSGAELSAAQGAYVASRCGWLSDRTAAYLASGRPALVQDTGAGAALPVGEGLLTFTDLAGAEEGARRLLADPAGHAEAAVDLARTHLDSDLVLANLLERLGLGSPVS
ncbi:MAG: glycosyltransferase family 1 protein [Actinobacteria bacterium]|nr:glycosyltransferase family 1 protein [Actinomycetota bacterium]